MTRIRVTLVAACLGLIAVPVGAQTLAEASAAAKKMHHDWPASAGLLTAGPRPEPEVPATPATAAALADPARQAALAALRAVNSVVDGGANTTEFKKYYLDARVKVDGLPAAPENTPIRNVAAIYEDASRLFLASIVSRLDRDDVAYFRQKYSYDASFPFDRVFGTVPSEGFGIMSTRTQRELGVISARAGGSMLLARAAEKLSKIQ